MEQEKSERVCKSVLCSPLFSSLPPSAPPSGSKVISEHFITFKITRQYPMGKVQRIPLAANFSLALGAVAAHLSVSKVRVVLTSVEVDSSQ